MLTVWNQVFGECNMFDEKTNYKCPNGIRILEQHIMCFELDASVNGYFDKFAFNLNNFAFQVCEHRAIKVKIRHLVD